VKHSPIMTEIRSMPRDMMATPYDVRPSIDSVPPCFGPTQALAVFENTDQADPLHLHRTIPMPEMAASLIM